MTTALLLAVLSGTTYEVGPGREMNDPLAVPWADLQAGDVVRIHRREEAYRCKFVLCCRGTAEAPVVVSGVADGQGRLPVIDGRDAVTPPGLNFWNEPRGVVKIGGANVPADRTPAHVVLENLDIRSARPGFSFAGRDGRAEYASNAAAVFVEKGEHLTIRGCRLHDCGNGLFVAGAARAVTVRDCRLWDNGIEGSFYEHNAYTEAAGMTYLGCDFGPLRAGCGGNNLKDRSAGLTVRRCRIVGGNRQLDLVDAGRSDTLEHPAYGHALIEDNLLVETDSAGNGQVVHFGGDSAATGRYRPGPLVLRNNTVVSLRPTPTVLLRLSVAGPEVRSTGNLVDAAGALVLRLHGNDRVEPDHDDWVSGRPPGFRGAAAGDFRLTKHAPATGYGAPDEVARITWPVQRQTVVSAGR